MKTGMKDSVLSYFTEIYDGKVVFKTNLAGGFDIKAGEFYDNDKRLCIRLVIIVQCNDSLFCITDACMRGILHYM